MSRHEQRIRELSSANKGWGMDNEMKAKVRNAALAEAVAAVPGGALCDPQQVADAIRALMTEPQLADDIEREFGIAPAADVRDATLEEAARECERRHANGNYAYTHRDECAAAIRGLRTTSAAPAAQTVVWLKQASSFGPWVECAPEDEGAVRFTAPADAEKGGA